MNRRGIGLTKSVGLDSIAAGVMCLYAVLIYCGYINGALVSVQSLCLYGLVGLSLLLTVKQRRLALCSYWVWYGGFIIYCALSVLYASSPYVVLSSLYGLIIVFVLGFALAQLLTSETRIELLLRCFVVGSVVLMLYLFVTGQINTEIEHGGRFGGNLTGNANTFASLFMFSAYASVYFIWKTKELSVKLLYVLAFVIQMYALILSGGRKFMLTPFIVMYVMLLLSRDRRGKKHIISYSFVGVASAVVILYLLMNVPFLYDNIGYRFEGLLNYITGISSEADYSTIQRELMSARAFELWLESPIIGHGLNMFSVIGGWGVYSHRNYLELLCNHGLIGFVIYYAYWVNLAVQLFKLKQNTNMKVFMIAVLMSFLIFDYGAVSYTMPQLHFFLVMISMYLYITKQKNRGWATAR